MKDPADRCDDSLCDETRPFRARLIAGTGYYRMTSPVTAAIYRDGLYDSTSGSWLDRRRAGCQGRKKCCPGTTGGQPALTMAGRPRSTAGAPRHSARMGRAIRSDNSIRRNSCQQAAHGCHRQRLGQPGRGRDECRANVCRACRAGYPECPSRDGRARAETARFQQPPGCAARPADDPRSVLPGAAGTVRVCYDFPLELGQRVPQGLRALVRPVPDRCSSRPAHVRHESNACCSCRSRAAAWRVHPRQLPAARSCRRRLMPSWEERHSVSSLIGRSARDQADGAAALPRRAGDCGGIRGAC
jgi:hypothetical protein